MPANKGDSSVALLPQNDNFKFFSRLLKICFSIFEEIRKNATADVCQTLGIAPAFVAIIDGIYFGVPAFIIYFCSLRLLKSPALFLGLSWGFALLTFGVAKGLTFKVDGEWVKEEGTDTLTTLGVFYSLFTFPSLLVLFAVHLVSLKLISQHLPYITSYQREGSEG